MKKLMIVLILVLSACSTVSTQDTYIPGVSADPWNDEVRESGVGNLAY